MVKFNLIKDIGKFILYFATVLAGELLVFILSFCLCLRVPIFLSELSRLHNNITEWTLVPFTGSRDGVRDVRSYGFVYVDGAYYPFAIRPVIYLLPDVKIVGGDGSSSNPYNLSL